LAKQTFACKVRIKISKKIGKQLGKTKLCIEISKKIGKQLGMLSFALKTNLCIKNWQKIGATTWQTKPSH